MGFRLTLKVFIFVFRLSNFPFKLGAQNGKPAPTSSSGRRAKVQSVYKRIYANFSLYKTGALHNLTPFKRPGFFLIRELFDFVDKLEQPSRGHFRYRNRVGRFGHCSR